MITEENTKTSVSEIGNIFEIKDGTNDKTGNKRLEYNSATDSYSDRRLGKNSKHTPAEKKSVIRAITRRLDILSNLDCCIM